MYPEGGFKETVTHGIVREALLSFGIKEKQITNTAVTGMVVDMWGTGVATSSKKEDCHLIALRADMDGLPIPENAKDLSYRTTTDHAHMCGHDGHMAVLLAAV